MPSVAIGPNAIPATIPNSEKEFLLITRLRSRRLHAVNQIRSVIFSTTRSHPPSDRRRGRVSSRNTDLSECSATVPRRVWSPPHLRRGAFLPVILGLSGRFLRGALLSYCLFTAEAARFTAHRRLIASASRLRPSGVIRTFRRAAFTGVAAGVASAAFFAAHRLFCPSDRRFRLIPPLRVAGAFAAGPGAAIPSIPRNAASARSMAVF